MRLRRVLRVVGNVLDERVRLRVFALQPRHQHASLAVGVQDERHRTLGRHKRETDVIEDIGRIEQDGPVEAELADMPGELLGSLPVFGFLDLHAARSFSRQSGSSSRNRLTRSPTGGCVTNRAASPTSRNGLIVYSGSVAGLPWNETSSEAWSRRMSASRLLRYGSRRLSDDTA